MMDAFLGFSSSSTVSPVTHHLQVSAGEAGSIPAGESGDHPHLALTKARGMLCSCCVLSSLEQQFPRSLKGFVYPVSMVSNVSLSLEGRI